MKLKYVSRYFHIVSAKGADYSFEVKTLRSVRLSTFFKHNNSSVASINDVFCLFKAHKNVDTFDLCRAVGRSENPGVGSE